MDPKLIKAHNQTASLKSLVFYSLIKIYTRENRLHFIRLPDYNLVDLFSHFHSQKFWKHTLISAQWKDAQWSTNFHRITEVSKVTRGVGDRKGKGSHVWPCSCHGNWMIWIINLSLVSVAMYHGLFRCSCLCMPLQPCHSECIPGSCFQSHDLDVAQSTNRPFHCKNFAKSNIMCSHF